MRILAADVGGTNLRAALVDPSGVVLAQEEALNPGGTAGEIVGHLLVLFGRVLAIASGRPAAASVAVAGLVDADRGRVLVSPNIPAFRDTPLVELLAAGLDMPVFIENDASAAALGEARFGAGRGLEHLLHVTLGTGIGGGIVIGRRLYRGATGAAGEIGHTIIEPGGPECSCGSRGCLEAVVSGTAFARRARYLVESGRSPVLGSIAAGRQPDGADLFLAARQGDPLAEAEIRHGGHMLGLGLGGAINILNPSALTLSGGLLDMGEMLLGPMREAIYSLPYGPASGTRVILSELGDSTGILGAAAVALERIE